MTNIHTEIVAICALLAGLAWLIYARSQSGRKQSRVLAWLSLPFFTQAAIYTWFSLIDVDIHVRAIYARLVIFGISISQAIVLIILSYLSRGSYAKH